MSQDELQSIVVFVLPWAGLPIGALITLLRQHYQGRRCRQRLLEKRLVAVSPPNYSMWAPCPEAWYNEQFTLPLAQRSVNW